MILLDKLKQHHLILASASPRRFELMKGAGFDFEQCVEFSVDESYPEDMNPTLVPEYLAKKKSIGFGKDLSERDILITADTVVIAENQILGKPEHAEDAIQMLTKLSGKDHFVYTGVCIRTLHTQESFTCISKVGFRILTSEEIHYYVRQYAPMDKAGAYGIQEWIGYVGINHIEGSYFNVMGLPIQQIYVRLDALIA